MKVYNVSRYGGESQGEFLRLGRPTVFKNKKSLANFLGVSEEALQIKKDKRSIEIVVDVSNEMFIIDVMNVVEVQS